MASSYKKSNQRPPRPPCWKTSKLAELPAHDPVAPWVRISWPQARRDLASGLCIEFSVPPEQMLDFIANARSRLQVPCGVRAWVRKQRVIFYPKPPRHVTHPSPPSRAILRADFRARLRSDAIVRTIVADAGTYLQRTPCGFDYRAGLALFIQELGDGYGVAIPNVETLAAWIAAAERSELLTPYAVGEITSEQTATAKPLESQEAIA